MAEINQEHELIKRYHANDEEAQITLLNKYNRLIWSIVYREINRYRLPGIDVDDLHQEGMIALNDAISNYDLSMNVPLYCLANICISRKIKTYLKRYSRITFPHFCISLDANVNDDDFCLHEIIADKNSYYSGDISVIDDYLCYLDNMERKILLMRIKGFKYTEIAQEMVISTKDVDNYIQKMRKKIKKGIAQSND